VMTRWLEHVCTGESNLVHVGDGELERVIIPKPTNGKPRGFGIHRRINGVPRGFDIHRRTTGLVTRVIRAQSHRRSEGCGHLHERGHECCQPGSAGEGESAGASCAREEEGVNPKARTLSPNPTRCIGEAAQ
jgi:hypothetical protein